MSSSSLTTFEYDSAHDFPAPPEVVWDELRHLDRYPEWSRWLASYTVDGDGLTPGTVLRLVIDPPGPLRARLTVTITRVEAQRAVNAEVEGDLEGRAWVRLEESGAGTRVTISWRISAVGSQHRAAAVVARPFSHWLQWAMAHRTAARFRRHLVSRTDLR